jgi:ribosome biogenesis GTPase A
MKDYISPVSLIIHRVPKLVLEEHYQILLPAADSKSYTASTFLQVLGAKKGLVTGRGLPNEAIAARFVLKDYVNGRLLFCHIRPDFDRSEHGDIVQSGFKTHTTVGIPQVTAAEQEESKQEQDEEEIKENDEDD